MGMTKARVPLPRRRSGGMLLVLAALALALTACALEPPITVSQRESAVGQGIVIGVTNTSGDYLHEVVVDITSPAGETRQLTMVTLNPHESVNIGWLKLDGWPIPEGSEVSVSAKGFMMASGPWQMKS
ncbi:MAG: hypothetical protein GY719_00985 [bacterium]|nr:hypothetical protein [bacterium]